MPAIVALELLQGSSINQVSDSSNSCSLTKQQLVSQYPQVFTGLGKFGAPVTLELKSTAAPRAVPARLVPVKKRKRLKAELDRLVESGVKKAQKA